MARKKKHPEHINLERWLISYADFITLLFATFVVLYALSQVDIHEFKDLENSMKKAFSAPSIMQGSEGIMDSSSNSILDFQQADSVVTPLMMEYVSQRYENLAMTEVKKAIEKKIKSKEIDGIKVLETDRGLVIRFNDEYLFNPGSAKLTPRAMTKLDKVGAIIAKKFFIHNIRVEGYTDNQAIHSKAFPSNWELSSARASSVIRHFISSFGFMPSLFSAVGFADTRPIADNKSKSGRAKNRHIDVLILKNKLKSGEYATNEITKMSKEAQDRMQMRRINTINRIESISDAARNLKYQDPKITHNAILLNQVYNKETNRISNEVKALDSKSQSRITGRGLWLKPPAKKSNSKIRINEIKVFH